MIDSAGRPNVAFVYTTSYPSGSAPEFVQGNSEIFVTRFDNGVWGPVGPAVPTGDSVAAGAARAASATTRAHPARAPWPCRRPA